MPLPLPQASQIHGPVAPQRRPSHLGRSGRPCFDDTGLVAVTCDQVVAAVDLSVALERDSQGSDLPNQFQSRRSIGRVKSDVDCQADSGPAFLYETVEQAAAGAASRAPTTTCTGQPRMGPAATAI